MKPSSNPHLEDIRNVWAKAYLATDYIVSDKNFQVTISVGKYHPLLDAYLLRDVAHTWAYITAWNPYSQSLPAIENQLRNEKLEATLTGMSLFIRKGYGKAHVGDWSEESFLVFPMNRNILLELGAAYGQHAVLYGEVGGRAELLWC